MFKESESLDPTEYFQSWIIVEKFVDNKLIISVLELESGLPVISLGVGDWSDVPCYVDVLSH